MQKRKLFLYLFGIFFSLLVIDIVLYLQYKISFAGYYSDVVVFWGSIISFIICIIFYWKKIIAKISLFLFILGIVASYIPMGIPFWAIVLANSSLGLDLNKKLNDKYRFQIVGYSIMTPPIGQVIENKYFFFEKQLEDVIKRQVYIPSIKDVDFVSEDENFIYLKITSTPEGYTDTDIIKIKKDKD